MSIAGIYKILNVTNGKYYVGGSLDIHRRWQQHKSYLRKGTHDNDYLQKSWNKHGSSSFVLEIVEELPLAKHRTDIHVIEQKYLTVAESERTKTYNLNFEATGGKLDDYAIQKLMGENNPMYGRRGKNHPSYGYKHTMEAREAISKFHLGKPKSSDARKKMSEAAKKLIVPNALDKRIWHFVNVNGSEYLGIQYDFRKHFDLTRSKVNEMVNGKRKQYRGWKSSPWMPTKS